MPEEKNEDGDIGTLPLGDRHVNNAPEQHLDSGSTYRASVRESELAGQDPYDSQAPLGERDGRNATLGTRLGRALGLSRKRQGSVDQIVRSLNEYAAGYGKVAAIGDLDPEFLIFRKFGWLRNYALLHLQDELVELQEQLESLDKWEFSEGDFRNLHSRRRDYRKNDLGRKELLQQIHHKLAQYDEALLRMQNIQSIKRPTNRAQRNLRNLISNTQSLVGQEMEWASEGPDLAALYRGPEYSWLNTFFEDLISKFSKRATTFLFRTDEQRIKSGDENLTLTAQGRLDVLVRIMLTLLAAVLLLVPVAILFKLQPNSRADFQRRSNYQILTVFLFTLVFSASCSIFTKARRQEVFAATAAYSAVLVVFLGNTSNVVGMGEVN